MKPTASLFVCVRACVRACVRVRRSRGISDHGRAACVPALWSSSATVSGCICIYTSSSRDWTTFNGRQRPGRATFRSSPPPAQPVSFPSQLPRRRFPVPSSWAEAFLAGPLRSSIDDGQFPGVARGALCRVRGASRHAKRTFGLLLPRVQALQYLHWRQHWRPSPWLG